MTDTGRIPGEGLPEHPVAEAVLPPHGDLPGNGVPQQAAWGTDAPTDPSASAYTTYLDHPAAPAPGLDDEDDVLLMPGPQGSWSDPQPVPPQPPVTLPPGALPPEAYIPADAADPEAEQPAPGPAVFEAPAPLPAPGEPQAAAPEPAAPAPQPLATAAPRRPLHLGPPIPDTPSGGVSVRSLADRGPAHAQHPPVRTAGGPPTAGPEYLDVPRDDSAGIPAQQTTESGEPAAPVPGSAWPAAPAASQSLIPHADSAIPAQAAPEPVTAAEPVPAPAGAQVPQAAPEPAAEAAPQAPAPQAAPVPESVPEAAPEAEPVAVVIPAQAAPQVSRAPRIQDASRPAEARAPQAAPEPVAEPAAEVPAPQAAPEPAAVPDPAAETAAAPPAPPPVPEAAPEPESEPAADTASGTPTGPAAPLPHTQPPPAEVLAEVPAPPAAPEAPAAPADLPASAPADVPLDVPLDAVPAAPVPAAPVPVAAPAEQPVPAGRLQAFLGDPEPVAAAEPPAVPDAAAEPTAAEPAPAEPPAPAPARSQDPEPVAAAAATPAAPEPVAEPAAEIPAEPDPGPAPAAPEPLAAQARADAPAGTPAAVQAPPATPAAEPYEPAVRDAVHRVIRERRDVRNGFRPDPIPHDVLLRVLEAAHTAPSVGHSQPWDFVVIRSEKTREKMHELAAEQREAYARSLPKGRARQFRELKIEAILDTPVNIVVTADPTRGGRHTLGRHTQPQMAPYSSALAVENLWLAARAEGLGVGWVSFFDERQMVAALGLPEHLEVVAYLCVGYVDEFPEEPELTQAGWSQRRPLSWVVHEEEYGNRALPGGEPQGLLDETLRGIRPLDAKALGEAWERQKRMTKPAGALGMLEIISAQLSGLSRQCPPPIPEPAAVAIFAGDHGVHAQGVTSWPQEVTAQMVANFLGGGAVVNAFANQVGAEVCVVDVGVASELPATPGLLPRKVRAGTADFTAGPAMTREEALKAIEVGIETARDLVSAGNRALLTGEMGIANTTTSAALIAVFTGADPAEVTGRGTGINDEMHARKIEVVRRALDLHRPDPADPIGVLTAIGGLEHAAMVGLLLGAAALRTPVILDGVSAGAAALVARAIAPEVLAACIAGHRSAEPGHVAALTTLGLRPLVDLDLRLGEGTGALLALPLVQSAARVMHEVATFDAAGVTEKS